MAAEIFDAIRAGNTERLKEILASDRAQLNARSERGHSPVMIAQYHRKKDLVQEILAAGPELDVFDAATVGRADRVTQHLDRDPSLIGAYSSDGFTALHLAAYFGFPEAVKVLLARGASVNAVARNPMKVQALHSAASDRHLEVVKLLVAAGADVNGKQEKGWMPLHAAAKNGDLAMVTVLLEAGADPTAQSDEGKSAIGLAAEGNHTDVLKALKAGKR